MKTHVNSLDIAKNRTKIWQWILQVFVGSNELQLWQTHDGDGHQWWHMYDRATSRYSIAESETELRRLIEQRYSRR